ncbi:MAG: hypothetical protein J5644_02315 [Bacteroidales bacterium]|nr:hypothetical protein [Bacteroidales bacterium]
MEHIFRLFLLYVVYVVPIHFMDIEDKFIIQIGGILGITLAYIVAMLIIKKLRKKNGGN